MPDNDRMLDNMMVAFIDTSVIDPMYNNYGNMEHLFYALKKHISSKKLILLIHEIAVREIENHIKDEIPKQIEKVSAIQKSKEFALIRANPEYNRLFHSTRSDKIVEDTIKAFREKLEEIDITVLKTGPISTKGLMDDYFSSTPPFGAKNKKCEFPDAIMLQSLIKNVGEDEKTHIISSDGDWENICQIKENLLLHKSLNAFLDYVNKDNIAASAIRAFLEESSTRKLVAIKMEELIHNINFIVDGQYLGKNGYVEGYSYNDIELIDIHDTDYMVDTIEDIDHINGSQDSIIVAIVTILGSANISFNCTFYENIRKKYRGRAIETHEFYLPICLSITGDYKKELKIENYTIIETEDLNDLHNGTLINREYL